MRLDGRACVRVWSPPTPSHAMRAPHYGAGMAGWAIMARWAPWMKIGAEESRSSLNAHRRWTGDGDEGVRAAKHVFVYAFGGTVSMVRCNAG